MSGTLNIDQDEAIRAAIRVCMLADAYLSTLPREEVESLRAVGTGFMTLAEVQCHLRDTRRLLLERFKTLVPNLQAEHP